MAAIFLTAGICIPLVLSLSPDATAAPVRSLPTPAGPILDLRASGSGDLYIRTPTNILHLNPRESGATWKAVPLEQIADMTENASHDVFVRQDQKATFAFHRLSGANAVAVNTTPGVPCELWYVDALGRVWLQAKDRLLVVDKERTLLEQPARQGYRGPPRRFNPCEWQPGHLALIFGTDIVWATPNAVKSGKAPPPFDEWPPSSRMLKTGSSNLVIGAANGGSGSIIGRDCYYLFDPDAPNTPPANKAFDWYWFAAIAAAPDGRLLILAMTTPPYVAPRSKLLWMASDGRLTPIKAPESIVRLWADPKPSIGEPAVLFTSRNVGFAIADNGLLATFQEEEATLLTPVMGLPLQRVEHAAVIGDELILAGNGQLVAWQTTEPLQQAGGFDDRTEWPLAGPCTRDNRGELWTFLRDYPGKISHHDGRKWRHLDLELGGRTPFEMTSDNHGRIQIGFSTHPSGSAQLMDGIITNWPNAPTRAWLEACKAGASFFSDGSPYRPQHVAAGNPVRLWAYNGRILCEERREYDHGDVPPYTHFWLTTNGVCYRSGYGRTWVLERGRWSETPPPPLSIGANGIGADTAPGRLPLIYDGQLRLPQTAEPTNSPQRSSSPLTLEGNEAFLPATGGGWLGKYRVFRNAFYPLPGRIYPGTNGTYLIASNMLHFQAQQTLTITGALVTTGKVQRLSCHITGTAPLYKPRIITLINGSFIRSLSNPEGGHLPEAPTGTRRIEVYAADGFGVISATPLQLTIEGNQPAGIEPRTWPDAWSLKPQRFQTLPLNLANQGVQGRALEIDSDGIVWILVEGGVMSIDPTRHQAALHRFPVREIISARGRAWALGSDTRDRLEWPLYELRRDGIRHAVNLYDDASSTGYSQISADSQGGIWALSHRAITRWDGKGTQFWDRPIGGEAIAGVVPYPLGTVIHTRDHYFIYRNGELGPAIPWDSAIARQEPGTSRLSIHTLGMKHIVLAGSKSLIELDTGQISQREIPLGNTRRLGANGNLYIWDDKRFVRVSGDDVTVTPLVYAKPPSDGYRRFNTSLINDFLATTNGLLAYPAGSDCILIGHENGELTEYGATQGVEPADSTFIREAPDGRIWILRPNQILIYDPSQPGKPIASAGTESRPTRIGPGWHISSNRGAMVKTDGLSECSWNMPSTGDPNTASDQGGTFLASRGKVFVLHPGGDGPLLAARGTSPAR